MTCCRKYICFRVSNFIIISSLRKDLKSHNAHVLSDIVTSNFFPLTMMRIYAVISVLAFLPFCVPRANAQSAGDNPYSPCNTGTEQMYPHRRSLSQAHSRRQFVSIEVIPGQGPNAPPPAPPSAKYIISQAVVQQGPAYMNGSQKMVPERFSIVVANATQGSNPVTCSIDWNPPGAPNSGYQMSCLNFAFCAILTQQTHAVEDGFYLYISLP